MPVRSSQAEWHGSLREGHGHMRVGNGVFEGEFTFGSRFENAQGTNPEELIAAAHAGCFSMQLSGVLTSDGHPPKSIRTIARVRIDVGAGGADITSIDLETVGEVPGIDAAAFNKAAQRAKEICPVSKALKAVPINVKATFK